MDIGGTMTDVEQNGDGHQTELITIGRNSNEHRTKRNGCPIEVRRKSDGHLTKVE